MVAPLPPGSFLVLRHRHRTDRDPVQQLPAPSVPAARQQAHSRRQAEPWRSPMVRGPRTSSRSQPPASRNNGRTETVWSISINPWPSTRRTPGDVHLAPFFALIGSLPCNEQIPRLPHFFCRTSSFDWCVPSTPTAGSRSQLTRQSCAVKSEGRWITAGIRADMCSKAVQSPAFGCLSCILGDARCAVEHGTRTSAAGWKCFGHLQEGFPWRSISPKIPDCALAAPWALVTLHIELARHTWELYRCSRTSQLTLMGKLARYESSTTIIKPGR